MLVEAIYHRPKSNYAYASNNKLLHIRIRTKKDDMSKVTLHYFDKCDSCPPSRMPMAKFASDSLFDYYQAEIEPPNKRTSYSFHLEAKDGEQIWMTERGFYPNMPEHTGNSGLFEFPYLNGIDAFKAPEWVKSAVFYQIFPERFANGDPSNDPDGVQPWGGNPEIDNFFGGDLQGIIDHLDHLNELGINAIYFTPVFEATSNHKYDTVDYMKIDPHFGDNQLMKRLVEAAHQRGIKVMLDAVFNHSGFYFPPFQDVMHNQEHSKYVDWFHVNEFPIRTEPRPSYSTFAFTHMMPKLNTENHELKDYLLQVARYWVREIGIDGWRLDVANEVDHQFWREFRQAVKEANPEAYILGEIWHNALPWLQGDQFDAVMNYPATESILAFFCKNSIHAAQFADQINKLLVDYPWPVNQLAFNLLDSHDTPRLLEICGGDKRKMKLAVTFQFTFMGAPCIYYGDEVGMTGRMDPDCRRTMIWDPAEQDRALFDFYKQIVQVRKDHSALRDGKFGFIAVDHERNLISYERWNDREHFIIAMNATDRPVEFQLDIPQGDWVGVFGNHRLVSDGSPVEFQLDAFESVVLMKK